MRIKKSLIFMSLLYFSTVSAAQNTPYYFHLNNQSSHKIYVWVRQAVNVTGPDAGKPPYLAMIIKPHTNNVRLRYVIDAWNDKTVFSLAFCKISARSCINTHGEYSSITIVPASESKWKVKDQTTWSGMMLPLPAVSDNVSYHSGVTWNRHSDFPYQIRFYDNRRSGRH